MNIEIAIGIIVVYIAIIVIIQKAYFDRQFDRIREQGDLRQAIVQELVKAIKPVVFEGADQTEYPMIHADDACNIVINTRVHEEGEEK